MGAFAVRALFVISAVTLSGATSLRADQPLNRLRSSPTAWEHLRAIGQRTGIPRTLAFTAPPTRSLAIGDFDGDGDADVVVGTTGAREVVVLLGDALRPFGSAVLAARADWPTVDAEIDVYGEKYMAQSSPLASTTTVRYRSGNAREHPQDLTGALAVVDDFDGDGTVDVAAAPPDAAAMASGDFDGDAITDLVVADGRSVSVTMMFGDRSGGFSTTGTIDVGIKAAANGLAAGDIDSDGVTDLVVLGAESGRISILRGDGSRGLIPFAQAEVDLVPVSFVTEALATTGEQDEYRGVASLTLNPATIAGGSGATSTGTITLNAAAPAGGVVVTLASSNTELAASVASITVPAGASTATFTIGTNKNYRRYSGLAFSVTISATHGATTQSASLSVTAQPRPGTLSSFDVHNEGPMCFGVGVRPTGSGYELEFGSAGNLFNCVPPSNPVGQDGVCTFRQECSLGCEVRPPQDGFKFRDVCATTGPFPVAVNPKLVVGGNASLATLRLNAAAPASSSGTLSSFTVLANTIPNISTPIPAGATTANADVLTARVNSPQFAPIDGSYYTPRADGSRGGRIGLSWLALAPGTPPPFRLTSFNFDPSTLTSVVGGTTLFAFGQMNQVAPSPEIATATMAVSSSNSSVASIPRPMVTFTHGSSNAGVGIETHAVSADTVVTISAMLGDTTLTRQLTVKATPAATAVKSYFLDPLEVTGGNSSTGLVVLNGAVGSAGASVSLQSSNPGVATTPATVTVPPGSDRVSFTVTTAVVSSSTTVGLSASYNGSFAATSLIVSPASSASTLASLAVNPSTVVGGNNSTGTAALSAAAPSGGAVISLSSSNTAVATVPASVTIAAGATSATFAVTTASVSTSTSVTISAAYNGVTRTAALTVAPAGSGSLTAPTLLNPANDARFSPGAAITFDWSDVGGAANYTIQIDDSESFSAPLVVNQTTAASQFTTSTLPTRRMWWRVRATNAAGTAGPWSAVRRLEVRN